MDPAAPGVLVNVHTSEAAEIAKALGGKRSGKGWACKCPAHDDGNASCSISDGRNGSPVFHCHAGCTQDEVMAALIDRELWSAPGNFAAVHYRRMEPPASRAQSKARMGAVEQLD